MQNDKVLAYVGFARKSGNLRFGYHTCLAMLEQGKVKLILLADDGAGGTKKKFRQKCRSTHTAFRIYGKSDELSKIAGGGGNTVFAVTDENFAKVIIREIDGTGSEGEMCNDEKGI